MVHLRSSPRRGARRGGEEEEEEEELELFYHNCRDFDSEVVV